MVIRKQKIKRAAAGLLAVLLTLLACGPVTGVSAGDNAETRVLRVGFTETTGISETDEYGNRHGLVVDYLNEIAKYTNWEYEYIDTTAENLVDEFLEGKFDLMGGTYYSPGFEEYFAYPDYSMGNSRAALLCREDNMSIKSYVRDSLNGKVIGVYQPADEKIRRLKDYLQINALDCELRYYTTADVVDGTLYCYLDSGEVDLLLGSTLEGGGKYRIAASFDAQPYYIVTNIGNDEVLDGLNMALEKILDCSPRFAEERYEASFQEVNTSKISFNEEEKAYIADKKNVTVAVAKDWHPFYCNHEEEDHHDGIVSDLIQKLEDYTGLSFTVTQADTYAEAIKLVQEGKADLVGAYLDPEETAFQDGLALTREYVALNNIVLKAKSVDYPSSELTAGILNGRKLPDSIESREVKRFDTIQDMVDAVNQGEVDFIYDVSYAMEPLLQSRRYADVVPVARVNNNMSVALAMARPIDTNLMTILNKAIGSFTEDEKNTIMDRNLVSMGYASLTLGELIYTNPIAFITIIGLFLVLLTGVVLLVFRTRVRNTLMRGEIEKAEAKSRAKSEFLSRMSHEIRTPMNAIMGLAELTCREEKLPAGTKENLSKIRSSSQYLLSLINDILDMSRIENGKLEIGSTPFSLSGVLDGLKATMEPQAGQKRLDFAVESTIAHDYLNGDPVRLRQVLTNLLSNAVKFTPAGGRVRLTVTENLRENGAEITFSVKDNGVGIAPEYQTRIFDSFEQVGEDSAKSMGTGLGLPISSSIVKAMGGNLQVKSSPGEGSEFFFTLLIPLGKEPESQADSAPVNLEGVRILLAEDNDLNAEIAEELLKLQGIQCRRAVNGKEALDLFNASEPGHYQLVLMDMRMPVMDGLEATRSIRASGHPDAAAIPIVAMTANSFKEDEDAAYRAGMTGFVAKPVDMEHLYRAIEEALAK